MRICAHTISSAEMRPAEKRRAPRPYLGLDLCSAMISEMCVWSRTSSTCSIELRMRVVVYTLSAAPQRGRASRFIQQRDADLRLRGERHLDLRAVQGRAKRKERPAYALTHASARAPGRS